MLFQLRRRRRIWRGESRGGERREGSDITLMHRCKSSCNRDVCLSAMSERTTGLIMSGKKKVTGMRSSLVGCLPSCRPLPTHLCLFGGSGRRNATTAGTTNQSRGNFYAPTTKCGMPLFGHFCSDCAGIALQRGEARAN